MTDLRLLLETYPALPPAERAAVDARLAALDPAEAAPLAEAHAEARRLATFADALETTLEPDAPGALARRLAADHLGLDAAADAPADDDLDAQADALAARLRALSAGSEPLAARFERLTGRRLGPAAGPSDTPRGLAGPPRRRPGWPARLTAVTAVLAVAYGGLFAVSAATVSERAQVAALDEVAAVEAPVLRGATPSPADALGPALAAVADARRSTLGLFPRYDAAALDAAADALAAVAADADPASAASQEARLALGRVHLHRGRDAEAARVLGTLAAEGRYQAPTARRLLDYIRAQG